jgi:ribosomal protein L11 methylase PrmA
VLNIGCAEGYYAVGIKRLLPNAQVFAFDINPQAQTACQALAAKNGVELTIGGLFNPENFAQFSQQRTLVWCDIEGAERELLSLAVAPALLQMDLVVEFHPTAQGHTFNDVLPRFSASHNIQILYTQPHKPVLPAFLQQLGHLDQLLAQWEWRSAPTPWVIMRANG